MSSLRLAQVGAVALMLPAFAVALPIPQAVPPEPVLRCLEPVAGVTWLRWKGNGDAALNAWCESVGKPVLRAPVFTESAEITQLTILSWNVHVGGGEAEKLIPGLLKENASKSGGLVVLLQETFRTGWDVPDSYPPTLHPPGAIRPRRPAPDVTALASELDLSLAYVPSMRNGSATTVSQREDRGNAVLSTEPLGDVTAIELPFGKQRRVAIAATVTPRGSHGKPMRVIVVHLDPGDHRVTQADAFAATIKAFVATKAMPLVVAGDLNARKGLSDKAVTTLSGQIHREDECGTGGTSRLPLRIDVLLGDRLDYMFSTLDDFGLMRTCRTLSDGFGSDHVPLEMTIQF